MNILNESKELSCGIFWYDDEKEELIILNKYCDLEGNVEDYNDFNAKSGLTYNHKISWKLFQQQDRNYRKYSYKYFPRGRVMIKNGKVDIYMNQNLNTNKIKNEIFNVFGLHFIKDKIKWHIDNSQHYQCHLDDENIY